MRACLLSGLIFLGSLASCSRLMPANNPQGDPISRVERFESESEEDKGVQFIVDPDGCGGIPQGFPDYLVLPGSRIAASGIIFDDQGSVSSVRLRTQARWEAIAKHYRDDLWYRRWTLMLETESSGIHTWILEDTHSDLARLGRQIMIQIGSEQEGEREILLILSHVGIPGDPGLSQQCYGR